MVTLTVADTQGATGSKSPNVTLVNALPVASFTSTCSGLTCSVNGSASSDADGTIVSHAWAFGDGTSGSGAALSHTYAVAGTYTVTLTVTDNGGASATQTKTVTTSQAHVGDLDGVATTQGGSWTALVTIAVHDNSHGPVTGASVTGSWTGGNTGSCTTNATGRCTVSRSALANGTKTVTFTVAQVAHATLTYQPADNHDPDGDSTGTSMSVSRR